MKKNKKIIVIIFALIVVIVVGIFLFRKKEPAMVLATENPHYGYIANTVTATGTVQPVDTVAVGTQVSGTIKKVYVDFNSKVNKGQLLAELDKTIPNAEVQQMLGNLQQAQSQLIFQQENVKRQTQLYDAGAISKADLETAQNSYRVAEANVKTVRSQVDAAQKNLSLTNIYSPIDGTVLSRNVSEGQTVAASFSTPTLFSIAKDLTHMQVRAAVDEADIGNVKQGQRVTFTVDAFPDDEFDGTLLDIRLQPTVSSNVVTYTTIINAPNDELKLKPGMTANISIYTKEADSALLISARATKFKPDSSMLKQYNIISGERKTNAEERTAGVNKNMNESNRGFIKKDSLRNDADEVKRASVWLLDGKTLTRKFIRIGMEDGTQVQVLNGLTTKDEVVDGVQQAGTTVNQNNTQRSPFMPQRRRSGQQNSRGNTRPTR